MKSKKYFFTLHFLRNVLALYALTILKSQTQSTEKNAVSFLLYCSFSYTHSFTKNTTQWG